jgi:hypothetical protein
MGSDLTEHILCGRPHAKSLHTLFHGTQVMCWYYCTHLTDERNPDLLKKKKTNLLKLQQLVLAKQGLEHS